MTEDARPEEAAGSIPRRSFLARVGAGLLAAIPATSGLFRATAQASEQEAACEVEYCLFRGYICEGGVCPNIGPLYTVYDCYDPRSGYCETLVVFVGFCCEPQEISIVAAPTPA